MRLGRWWVAVVLCAIACLVSLWLGQDGNFDLKAYHLHNGWAAVNGRWSRDLFAAGPATFFSPFLDVPYFLLASWLLPSHGTWLVALAGLPYGLLLFAVVLIAERFAAILALEGIDRVVFIAACVLVAGTGAATAPEIGTTFNDIPIAVLVLAGFHQVLLAVANDDERLSTPRVAVAGILLGLAMGLKLTAAIHVPAMALVLLVVARGWRDKLRSAALFSACAFAGLILAYGPWAWKLWSLTGNPFFPLLNAVFQSDWMASVNARDDRFLPRSWAQWLFYPFSWTQPSSLVSELPFRDARLAVAFIVMAGSAAAAIAGRFKSRAITVLAVFLLASYVLWMRQFSILRYLLATECLAGILIVTGVMAVARRWRPRNRWMPALCVASIAGAIIAFTIQPRWGRLPAGTDILAVEAPALERGSLVILADNAVSFLAPGLAAAQPDLRFMGLPRWFANGGKPGRTKYGLERRMQARVAEHAGPLYVLYEPWSGSLGPNLAEFGIAVDTARCQRGRSPLGPTEFLVCRATFAPFHRGA